MRLAASTSAQISTNELNRNCREERMRPSDWATNAWIAADLESGRLKPRGVFSCAMAIMASSVSRAIPRATAAKRRSRQHAVMREEVERAFRVRLRRRRQRRKRLFLRDKQVGHRKGSLPVPFRPSTFQTSVILALSAGRSMKRLSGFPLASRRGLPSASCNVQPAPNQVA